MSLHTLAKRLLGEARQQTPAPAADLPIGSLTSFQQYPQLRYGDVDGIGTVMIDQTGNMVGFSPVERCNFGGETEWIPLSLVKNIRLEPWLPGQAPPRARQATTTPARAARTT